ncbi:MAG: hypothetical protein U1F45_07175 [Burkholderiales bacterium]
MDLVDSIRTRGFRKWYERQLVEGHLYLVTCFLCMILVAACAEQLDFRAPGAAAAIALVVGGGILGLYSWQRYQAIMTVAECYGGHSTCAQCGAYARFEVLDWGDPPPAAPSGAQPAAAVGPWLKVRCRKCGNGWTMP